MSTMTSRLSGLNSSSAYKGPCRAATTGNVTLAGYQTIDGVLPTDSQSERLRRIFVWQQTNAAENGIYVMQSGAWARAKDWDSIEDFMRGSRVLVGGGSTGFGMYTVSVDIDDDFAIDTDPITFTSAIAGDLGITLPTVDHTVPRFNGVNGMMESSGVTISDSNVMAGAYVLATGATTARLLSVQLGDAINVKNYGAVGDGGSHPLSDYYATLAAAQVVYPFAGATTDEIDWCAWQAAANAAVSTSTPKTVYGPPGIYRWNNSVSVTSLGGITFQGAGIDATQIFLVATTGKKALALDAVSTQGGSILVQDLYFPTPSGSGVTGVGNIAVSVTNNRNVTFHRVKIVGYRTGVVATGSFAPQFIDCHIQACLGPGIYAPGPAEGNGAAIIGCRFFGNGLTLSDAAIEIGGDGISIEACKIEGNYGGVLFTGGASGAKLHGSYVELSTAYNFYFGVGSSAIDFRGNVFSECPAVVLSNIAGAAFENNAWFDCSVSFDSSCSDIYIPAALNPVTGTSVIAQPAVADAFIQPVRYGGTGLNSFAIGDLLYADTTTTLAKLADVATGNALISGGAGTAFSWGKIGLTTHVSGTLGTGNGGTGVTSLGDITRANDTNVTLTLGGTPTGALISSTSFTLGWTGTLAAGRLNSNVVQAITNDTNVTGAISAQTLTFGWTGTLGVSRGGIGVGTLASNGVLYGNGTSAVQATAQGGANTILTANSGAPAWSSTPTIGGTTTINGNLKLGNAAASLPQVQMQSSGWNAIGYFGCTFQGDNFQIGSNLSVASSTTGNLGDITAAGFALNFGTTTVDFVFATAGTNPRTFTKIWTTDSATLTLQPTTAIPAGGSGAQCLKFSSTAGFGIFYGSGAPSLSAAKGSLYLRSDGSTTNNRTYINTDGSTTWTAITTAA